MFSNARFVKPQFELSHTRNRPTMVVEVEEPPTLTISSDEIITSIGIFVAMSLGVAKKIAITIGKLILFLYKKLSSLSIHVSFEEMREDAASMPKPMKTKTRYPGQLGLFTDALPQETSHISIESPSTVEPTGSGNGPQNRAQIFWIMFIALSFGLAASMVVR